MPETTREKPLTFSAWSVRRIREDAKTQTRRLAKLNELLLREEYPEVRAAALKAAMKIAPYQPGDICYVKEPYQIIQHCLDDMDRDIFGIYLADGAEFNVRLTVPEWERLCRRTEPFGKSPAMFMYRSLARERVRILTVRAQQIQQITREDAVAEGCNGVMPLLEFVDLWDSLHAANGNGFAANPWVFPYGFERLGGD